MKSIVYVPQNSGLRYVREKGIEMLERIVPFLELEYREVRGEEIPDLLRQCRDIPCPVIGITGEDLLREEFGDSEDAGLYIEYLNLEYTGPYGHSAFGLPTLCLLAKQYGTTDEQDGNGELEFEKIPDLSEKILVIPERYKRLVRSRLACKAENSKIIALDGKVEVTAAKNDSIDYAVDIVLTGSTSKEYNMGIVAALGRSDGVMLWNFPCRK